MTKNLDEIVLTDFSKTTGISVLGLKNVVSALKDELSDDSVRVEERKNKVRGRTEFFSRDVAVKVMNAVLKDSGYKFQKFTVYFPNAKSIPVDSLEGLVPEITYQSLKRNSKNNQILIKEVKDTLDKLAHDYARAISDSDNFEHQTGGIKKSEFTDAVIKHLDPKKEDLKTFDYLERAEGIVENPKLLHDSKTYSQKELAKFYHLNQKVIDAHARELGLGTYDFKKKEFHYNRDEQILIEQDLYTAGIFREDKNGNDEYAKVLIRLESVNGIGNIHPEIMDRIHKFSEEKKSTDVSNTKFIRIGQIHNTLRSVYNRNNTNSKKNVLNCQALINAKKKELDAIKKAHKLSLLEAQDVKDEYEVFPKQQIAKSLKLPESALEQLASSLSINLKLHKEKRLFGVFGTKKTYGFGRKDINDIVEKLKEDEYDVSKTEDEYLTEQKRNWKDYAEYALIPLITTAFIPVTLLSLDRISEVYHNTVPKFLSLVDKFLPFTNVYENYGKYLDENGLLYSSIAVALGLGLSLSYLVARRHKKENTKYNEQLLKELPRFTGETPTILSLGASVVPSGSETPTSPLPTEAPKVAEVLSAKVPKYGLPEPVREALITSTSSVPSATSTTDKRTPLNLENLVSTLTSLVEQQTKTPTDIIKSQSKDISDLKHEIKNLREMYQKEKTQEYIPSMSEVVTATIEKLDILRQQTSGKYFTKDELTKRKIDLRLLEGIEHKKDGYSRKDVMEKLYEMLQGLETPVVFKDPYQVTQEFYSKKEEKKPGIIKKMGKVKKMGKGLVSLTGSAALGATLGIAAVEGVSQSYFGNEPGVGYQAVYDIAKPVVDGIIKMLQ